MSSSEYSLILPSSSSESSDESSGLDFFIGLQQIVDQHDTGTSTRTPVQRNRVAANQDLLDDYFVSDPKYNEETFRTRFRMSKSLFLKIVDNMKANFPYFQESFDARMKEGFTPIQKCTSAIRQLATGNPPDNYDEYLAMSERTSRECLQFFCNGMVKLYYDEFLRAPTKHDLMLLYDAHEERHGIPGMIGSIDCTHWTWRNCPRVLRGQYHRGDHQYPTVILEAIASQDLWFWHGYFGLAGSNNDLNVLNQSPLFVDTTHGLAPNVPFEVNGRHYKRGYYLGDGIYPSWPVFVKTYLHPHDIKEQKFKKVQESARKDVERAFGVLKAKWGIINRPARQTDKNRLINVMYTCMIIHNMILKEEGRAISPVWIQDPPVSAGNLDPAIVAELTDEQEHFRLKFDLTQHVHEHLDIEID